MAEISFRFADQDSLSDEDLDDEDGFSIVQRLKELESGKKSSKTSTSWLKSIISKSTGRNGQRNGSKLLSIQSGDIVHAHTSLESPQIPLALSSRTSIAEPEERATGMNSSGADVDAQNERDGTFHRSRNGILFQFVHMIVQVLFFSIKTRYCVFPIASLCVLAANLLIIGSLTTLSLVKYAPQVNLNIEAFGIPTHPSQVGWDALSAAESNQFTSDPQATSNYAMGSNSTTQGSRDTATKLKRRRRSSHKFQPRSLSPSMAFPNCPHTSETQRTRHKYWMLDLLFRAPAANPNKNMLTLDRIKYIHKIEQTLQNSSDYQYFCLKTNGIFCDPLVSMLTWLYVTDHKTGEYIYKNPDHLPLNITENLKTHSEVLWFTGGELDFENSTYTATLLRSQLRIGVPLACFSKGNNTDEQEHLVTDYLISLIPTLENMSNSDVEILYGGSNIFDYQVTSAVIHDAILGAISVCLILLLMFILSGFSVWLTLGGFYSIITCFCPAYFAYRVIFNIQSIGILNVISIFVIVGIGIDDVFVFLNTYKQSVHFLDLHDAHQRMTHTILKATKATLFTSLTTSVAFFANTVSLIPAVQQFGIFMGLVVIFCFLQVFFVVPHFLFVWHHLFSRMENFIYSPIYRCAHFLSSCRNGRRYELGIVRMSEVACEDDSGIEVSSNSNSDNTSNNSNQSSSNSDTIEIGADLQEDGTLELVDGKVVPFFQAPETLSNYTLLVKSEETIEKKLTVLMQTAMYYVATVSMVLHLWTTKSLLKKKRREKFAFNICVCSLSYILLLAVSLSLVFQLQLSNQPPQFFSPDSNIQKMLDLVGNISDVNAVDGYRFSEWSSKQESTAKPSNPGGGTKDNTGGNPKTDSGSTRTTPKPGTTTYSSVPPSRFTTSPSPTSSSTNSKLSSQSSSATHSRPPSVIPTFPPHTPPTTPRQTATSDGTSVVPSDPGSGNLINVRFSNNAPVFVVFGVRTVKRKYNPSHVLPKEGKKISAVLDSSFSDVFSCNLNPYSGPTRISKLKGALNGLCRLCSNISNPQNGLVLDGNFQCFPQSHGILQSCILEVAKNISECKSLLHSERSKLSVRAKASIVTNQSNVTGMEHKHVQLRYLAMAFRSTSNPGNSPFSGIADYQKWEEFLSSELQAIKALSSKGDLYEGAEGLFSAFQASEYWVQVNIEAIAVSGSIYGILISFILCSVVVVFMSHDFRLVLTMAFTVVAILLTLCGLFWCFGWTIGIVEAISLSILVGNSLDYCIHMSEAFVSMDGRHLAFVEKFKMTSGASVRVKKVMAAISFIGVSIIGSAVTTILAILPLLGTQLQLFTRFGQILLLDTTVAIIFTIIICSNLLAFFGPAKQESKRKRLLNAVLTVGVTLGVYGLLFLVLYVASACGVHVPSPQGKALFK